MSEQNSVVVVSAESFSTGRSKYLSDGWISSQEKEEIAPDHSRPLFTRLKNQLTEYKAKQLLENQSENKEVKEIIFSTKHFKELGETQEERILAFKGAVRDTLSDVLKETGQQNVPWAGAVHQNNQYEHAHILIAKQYTEEKTGEVKSFPDYLPKQLFEKENGTTRLTRMFQTNLDKRIDQLHQQEEAKLEPDSPSVQLQAGQKTSIQKSYDNFFPTKKLIVTELQFSADANLDSNINIKRGRSKHRFLFSVQLSSRDVNGWLSRVTAAVWMVAAKMQNPPAFVV